MLFIICSKDLRKKNALRNIIVKMSEHKEPNNLIKIKITHLIKFAGNFKGIEVHVYVSGKYVKMNYQDEQFVDILRRLQQKDLEEVFINQADCKRVLDEVQKSLSSKSFYDPKTTDEKRVETVDHSFEIIKTFVKQLGIDKQSVEVLTSINQKTITLLNESPSIFTFIKRFKKNCSEEFMQCVLTSYLTSRVIDKFPWASIQVKEKASLASLLCDITLNKEDFEQLKDYELEEVPLNARILNHPSDVSNLLLEKRDIIPTETITIIEQHHERPDGSGFPLKIESNRFNQLSCIFIVCQKFIAHLFDAEFDYEQRATILLKIQKKYHSKPFEKAMSALVTVVA
jgi:hypothetical protein